MGITTADIGAAATAPSRVADASSVAAFAIALGDDPARYEQRGTAPPTYVAACWQPALRGLLSALFTEDELGGCVHLSHVMSWHRHVAIGSTVESAATLVESRSSRFGGAIALHLSAWDVDGPLCDAIHKVFVRGVLCETVGTPPDEPITVPRSRTNQALGVVRFDIPDDMPARYSVASGDNLPIHTDPNFARMQGFPRLILHGMATLALCARAVVDVGGGGQGRLGRVTAMFTRPVLAGDALEVAVASAGDAFAFFARQGRQPVIRHGYAALDAR